MEGPKDQHPVHLHTTRELLPPDKEETTTPEATFFVFLFHSPRFHPFTTNITQALPFKTIKGEAGAMSRGITRSSNNS
jgi:hypothetical protein